MTKVDVAARRATLVAGLDRLCTADPKLAAVLAEVGMPDPRILEPGFGSLLRIVVGQQVSTAAAAAIWNRLTAAGGEHPATFLAFDDEALGRIGLSRPKMRYGRALAEAVVGGRLEPETLARLPGEEVSARLVALPGIGRWTAEIYRMFALGDPDVFPVGDLALREGLRLTLGLDERPDMPTSETLTTAWRPERSAAALLLWRLYRHRRGIAVLGADGASRTDR